MKRKTEADLCMEHVLTELGLAYITEASFCQRKWRFDFAITDLLLDSRCIPHKLAIEIDGAVHSRGRHTRGTGFVADMEKLNFAAIYDWHVLRFTPQQVLDGTAKEVIKRWLESHR
jgi:very-short-patch-repair endonuclease